MLKIKGILLLLLFFLLVYTRFVNLSWGFPYPMHPDERNMAAAVQSLNCNVTGYKLQVANCFNPHFFAYGQFPLYAGYLGVMTMKFFDGDLGMPISFEEAALSLRVISAIASILNVLILLKIVQVIISKKNQITNYQLPITLLVFIFSPFFIQFSHFGTTESLLMFLYSSIIYVSLLFIQSKLHTTRYLLLTGFLIGLAIATKVSSVFFLFVPFVVLMKQATLPSRQWSHRLEQFYLLIKLLAIAFVVSVIFSPHNFISFFEFLGSMKYESDVALGSYRAFYTRQFDGSIPILFQLERIFPYALGWPIFIFSLLGFFFLPYKKEINFIRFAILAQFFPNAFVYAKWVRFVSPILPLMLVLAILFLFVILNLFHDLLLKIRFRNKFGMTGLVKFAFCILIFTFIIPGIAFLSIYQKPDIRFAASEWIYKNIPENSLILSETANVVDLPIPTSNFQHPTSNYQYISFDFYHVDENPELQQQLELFVNRADYIFVPSRRMFANHTCLLPETSNKQPEIISKERCEYLQETYPALDNYYLKLFSGQLGFEKVAEFTSYPKIQLFGKTLIEFPDEDAEETWTVFDHPVFRIYKRLSQKS